MQSSVMLSLMSKQFSMTRSSFLCRKNGLQLRAAKLVEQIAILRDTKHFVKDYQGPGFAPGTVLAESYKITSRKPQKALRRISLLLCA